MKEEGKITEENFQSHFLRFQKRQAGVSLVFCPEASQYSYNAYCIEGELLKELFSVEHEFLDDALDMINDEFSSWELVSYEQKKSGCSSCSAK